MSFDSKVSLSFGKRKVGKITVDNHFKKISFAVKDDLIDEIINSEYVIATYEESNNITLLLSYKGYFFIADCDRVYSAVRISNGFGEVYLSRTTDSFVPFLRYAQIDLTDNGEMADYNFFSWNELMFADDFESLARLYNKLDSGYLRSINEDDKTILLNCYQKEPENRISESFALKIVCQAEGVDFEVEYLTK
jgi:hypothetical protein